MKGILDAAKRELQARFSSVRDPKTGEFPIVLVEGTRLEDLRVRIDASPNLIAIIRERMSPQDLRSVDLTTQADEMVPKAFLSYTAANRALAEKIATAFQKNGVDTWWAEWEMGPGDSIRQKIDTGLRDCTHFLVLLTPQSIDRPWVLEEMDAGFVRMIDQVSKFIALRHALPVSALPPLLQGKLAPEIDADASNIGELINFIHGVSRKPALGPKPLAMETDRTGYSPAASKIAEIFAKESHSGHVLDPQRTIDELMERTGLTKNDVKDALHEMRHYLHVSHDRTWPQNNFFVEFDKHYMSWDAEKDALRLAADIVNDETFPASPAEIDKIYGWGPRRLNPALTYLKDRDLASIHSTMGSQYLTYRVLGTDSTRRFVASRT